MEFLLAPVVGRTAERRTRPADSHSQAAANLSKVEIGSSSGATDVQPGLTHLGVAGRPWMTRRRSRRSPGACDSSGCRWKGKALSARHMDELDQHRHRVVVHDGSDGLAVMPADNLARK